VHLNVISSLPRRSKPREVGYGGGQMRSFPASEFSIVTDGLWLAETLGDRLGGAAVRQLENLGKL
jgi:hypothetical protein